MDLLTGIYNAILGSLSIPYIVSTNILIFLIIKLIDFLNKDSIVPGITKKVVTALTGIVTAVLFKYISPGITNEVLLTSFLIVPFSYKYVIKYILKNFGIYYRELPGKTKEEEKQAADEACDNDPDTKL